MANEINEFIGFALAEDANVKSQTDFRQSDERQTGMQTGPADSALCNKVWRQGANMAAALGNTIASRGYNALDDGDIVTLSKSLRSALSTVPKYEPLLNYQAGAIVQGSDSLGEPTGDVYVSIQPSGPDTPAGSKDLTEAAYWQPIGSGSTSDLVGVRLYDSTKDYAVGDVVVHNGDLFICITANGPNQGGMVEPNDQNSPVWGLFYHQLASITRAGYMSAGDKEKLNSFYGILPYEQTATYFPGNVVFFLGSVYICTQQNTASDPKRPDTATAYWQKIVTSTSTQSAAGLMSAADKKKLDNNCGVYMYNAQTDYVYGDIVEYGIGLYGCLVANGPSTQIVAPDDTAGATYWLDIISGTTPAGGPVTIPEYDVSAVYSIGAVVINSAGTIIYIAKQANGPDTPGGIQPTSNSQYWSAFYACDPVVDITISGSTMTVTHASGATDTRSLPVYDNADTTSY